MKKVILFGATGQTGICLIPQLLKAGHEVTVYVRSPEKLNILSHKVSIIRGDAEDANAMQQALNGQGVVVSAFGTRTLKKNDIQEIFMKNLVGAMESAKVSRLIDLSAWGAGTSSENSSIFAKLIRATILKAMFKDKNRGEEILIRSNLKYTLVRPGRLTNGPARGNVKASLDGKGVSTSISRKDVASFMTDQIEDDGWTRKAPIIGY